MKKIKLIQTIIGIFSLLLIISSIYLFFLIKNNTVEQNNTNITKTIDNDTEKKQDNHPVDNTKGIQLNETLPF